MLLLLILLMLLPNYLGVYFKLDLNGRVTVIIIDNESNMKVAFPILTQKNQCENIQRLPCAAHTLQLTGLAPVEILVAHVKRIINQGFAFGFSTAFADESMSGKAQPTVFAG